VSLADEEYRRQAYEAGRRLTCRRKQCQARPGKPCVTKSGNKTYRDHSERFYDGVSKAASGRAREREKKRDAARIEAFEQSKRQQ
jgi:hypothetical protein